MKRVPKPIFVNTGEDIYRGKRISDIIDEFFEETKKLFERRYRIKMFGPSPYEIKYGELAYRDGPSISNAITCQITDDRVTYLSCNNIIIASVFETRTITNFVRYAFFRNLELERGDREFLEEFMRRRREFEKLE